MSDLPTLYQKAIPGVIHYSGTFWSEEEGWLALVEPDYTLTVDEDGEFRFDDDGRNKNLMMAEPGKYVLVRIGGDDEPCPACNDDGVLHTMSGDVIGPCSECAMIGGDE